LVWIFQTPPNQLPQLTQTEAGKAIMGLAGAWFPDMNVSKSKIPEILNAVWPKTKVKGLLQASKISVTTQRHILQLLLSQSWAGERLSDAKDYLSTTKLPGQATAVLIEMLGNTPAPGPLRISERSMRVQDTKACAGSYILYSSLK
jgi:hypothetical protein